MTSEREREKESEREEGERFTKRNEREGEKVPRNLTSLLGLKK